jgi:amino acid transporter
VSNVIGAGASFGILTSLLVAMMGQARYMCVIGRSGIVPTWFAKVHPLTATPVNASAFLGMCHVYFFLAIFLIKLRNLGDMTYLLV